VPETSTLCESEELTQNPDAALDLSLKSSHAKRQVLAGANINAEVHPLEQAAKTEDTKLAAHESSMPSESQATTTAQIAPTEVALPRHDAERDVLEGVDMSQKSMDQSGRISEENGVERRRDVEEKKETPPQDAPLTEDVSKCTAAGDAAVRQQKHTSVTQSSAAAAPEAAQLHVAPLGDDAALTSTAAPAKVVKPPKKSWWSRVTGGSRSADPALQAANAIKNASLTSTTASASSTATPSTQEAMSPSFNQSSDQDRPDRSGQDKSQDTSSMKPQVPVTTEGQAPPKKSIGLAARLKAETQASRQAALKETVPPPVIAPPLEKHQGPGYKSWQVTLTKADGKKFGFSYLNGKTDFMERRTASGNKDESRDTSAMKSSQSSGDEEKKQASVGPELLIVKKVQEEGLLHEWNQVHPDAVVMPGDRVSEVNGSRTLKGMQKELRHNSITMTIMRYGDRFKVELRKRKNQKRLGFKFGKHHGKGEADLKDLKITEVGTSGLLHELNETAISRELWNLVVLPGMKIEAVNSIKGSASQMAEELKTADNVQLLIRRAEVYRTLDKAPTMLALSAAIQLKKGLSRSSISGPLMRIPSASGAAQSANASSLPRLPHLAEQGRQQLQGSTTDSHEATRVPNISVVVDTRNNQIAPT